jgi:SAM-dependent methyltransferase
VTTSYELTRCAACGSAESREIADVDAMRREVEELWAFHGRRLRSATPPERLMDRVAFSEHPPYRLVECARCGLVYRNPIERARELEEIYADAAPDTKLLGALHETQRDAYRAQADRLLRALGRRGSGIEVGSYVGAFLAAARAIGLQMEGLDVNAGVNCFTRSLGFTVHDGDLESFRPDRQVDAVAIWNTFDQLPDPRAALQATWRLLRPGGVLALRVPNGEFYRHWRRELPHRFMGRVARLLLAHNNLLTFPYRYGFTVRSLTHLLEDVGFSTMQVVGDVLVPIADEYTRRWGAVEERLVKSALSLIARRRPERAPWIEVYAQRATPNA